MKLSGAVWCLIHGCPVRQINTNQFIDVQNQLLLVTCTLQLMLVFFTYHSLLGSLGLKSRVRYNTAGADRRGSRALLRCLTLAARQHRGLNPQPSTVLLPFIVDLVTNGNQKTLNKNRKRNQTLQTFLSFLCGWRNPFLHYRWRATWKQGTVGATGKVDVDNTDPCWRVKTCNKYVIDYV